MYHEEVSKHDTEKAQLHHSERKCHKEIIFSFEILLSPPLSYSFFQGGKTAQ